MRADINHNPCVDMEVNSPDFCEDLSGLRLFQVKSVACQKALFVHSINMESNQHHYSFSDAITDLQSAGFPAKEQAYGFSLLLQDSKTKYSVQCGHEHDGGFSISVNSGTPPVRWFVRSTIREMVDLFMEADQLLKLGQAEDWVEALNKIAP